MNYPEIIEHLKKISDPDGDTCRLFLKVQSRCTACIIFKLSGAKEIPWIGGWGCREFFMNNKEKIIQHFVSLNRKEKLEKLLS